MAELPVRRYFFPNSVKRFFFFPPPPIGCELHSIAQSVLFCVTHTGRLFKEKGVGWEDGSI